MQHINVIPIGSLVQLGTVEASVRAITINAGDAVQYQVSWWNGATRVSELVDADEIAEFHGELRRIGFKNHGRPE